MQPTSSCTNCGAEISSEARFCRSCGQRSTQFNPESVTEGTTRLLETPERQAPPGQHIYDHPGDLAQVTKRLPLQANPTSRSLENNHQSRSRVLIGSTVIVLLMFAALFMVLWNRSATPVSTPAVVRPELPPIQPPPTPSLPSPPPQGIAPQGSISRAYVYPGAETTMEMTDVSEGNVLQLQTSDSLDKVVSWYTEKLHPKQVVRTSGPSTSVILEGDEIQVVINSTGNRTSILLHLGGD